MACQLQWLWDADIIEHVDALHVDALPFYTELSSVSCSRQYERLLSVRMLWMFPTQALTVPAYRR